MTVAHSPSKTVSPAPFRVIVVGGGIAGLALSHALQLAGIEHVVLEAYASICSHVGASIGLWPNGIRILDQMGAWKQIQAHCAPLNDSYSRLPSGKAVSITRIADMIRARNGYDFVVLERAHVVQALWDALPDKSCVHTNKRVSNVVDGADGVRVETADGSVYEGDVVIGCDGVHSAVRNFMWANALVPAAEKTSLATTYKCLLGFAPTMPGLGAVGDCHVVHNHGFSFLIITQPERTFFFVFIKLPAVVRWPARVRFTADDAEREAAKLASLPVSETLLFGEIWASRLTGQLVPLEEVVFDTWHHGRIALLGDAVHKLTINLAFGGNSALESAAALANLLNRELKAHSGKDSHNLSHAAISRVFDEYQNRRRPRMKRVLRMAYQITRLQAWDGWLMILAQRLGVPLLGDEWAMDVFAGLVAGGCCLDYVPVPEHERGFVPFDDEVLCGELVRMCPGRSGSAALAKMTGMHVRLVELLLQVLLSAGLFSAMVMCVCGVRA